MDLNQEYQTLQALRTQRETTSHSPTLKSFNYVVETAIDNSISIMQGDNQIEYGSMHCIYDDTKDPIILDGNSASRH